jgi:hypothetical protein
LLLFRKRKKGTRSSNKGFKHENRNHKHALASSVGLKLLNLGVLRYSRAFIARQDENGFRPTPADWYSVSSGNGGGGGDGCGLAKLYRVATNQ